MTEAELEFANKLKRRLERIEKAWTLTVESQPNIKEALQLLMQDEIEHQKFTTLLGNHLFKRHDELKQEFEAL